MTHHVGALAWTLIHFCWQAAGIALIYRALDMALSRRSAHVRYLLALVALLAVLGAAVATFVYQEAQVASLPASNVAIVPDSALPPVSQAPLTVDIGAAPSGTQRLPAQLASGTVLMWIDVLWLVGVLILSARTLGGWWLIERLRRSAMAEAPEAVRACFRRACGALELARPVLLRISDRIAGPLTVGLFRPLVVLPLSAITALSPEQVEAVLAHELAHIRRKDYLWNMVQAVVETLFFFHPAVWWISRSVREQREVCCDDIALSVCSNPIVYADALFRLEEQRSQHLHMAMALDGNQSRAGLRARIARILGVPMNDQKRVPQPAVLLVVLTGIAMLLPLSGVLAQSQTAQPAADAPWAVPVTSASPATPVSVSPVAPVVVVNSSSPDTAPAAEPQPAAEPRPAAGPQPVQPRVPSEPVLSAQAPVVPARPAAPAPPAAKVDYIEQMRAAGYNVDLDKYVAMKIHGITSEYARSMSRLSLGTPSADDLIAMKIHGVTADTLSKLQQSGLGPKSFQEAISYQIFKVSPEYVAGMKAAGFESLGADKLVALRVQGVTPEYARQIRQQFPSATVDDLISMRIFRIDEAFIAQAKKHGFDALSVSKLVQLRISGLLDDEAKEESGR